MNDKDFDQYLDKELQDLNRHIAPSRDLWTGIEHAINDDHIRVSRPVAVAASVLLTASLVLSGFLYLQPRADDGAAVAEFIAMLQSDHEQNKQNLLVQYQDSTALVPDWEEQMQQLEQAEEVIYDALREDPENIELLKILRQVQSKQIELIDSVYAPMFTTI